MRMGLSSYSTAAAGSAASEGGTSAHAGTGDSPAGIERSGGTAVYSVPVDRCLAVSGGYGAV